VDLNGEIGESRIGPDRIVQRHKLALVSSGKVEFSPPSLGTGRAIFTAAEMRHNFAIWAVKNNLDTRPQRHLYYCIRCKQAFSVDDSADSVTPLDSHGNTLHGDEAIKRLDTFSCGPCPAFNGLGARRTSKIIPIPIARGRLTDLTMAGRRARKAVVARWHRLPTADRASQTVRSIRK
jgi:hypothetical protein